MFLKKLYEYVWSVSELDKKKDIKNKETPRHLFQAVWTFITNSFLAGFMQGKIYTGSLKHMCLPGLNCYSCPGALGSCPIGSLQSVLSSRNSKISLYVSGFLIFSGALFGRFICGWLCPFGLIQDLFYKIPFVKKITTFKSDRLLRKLKYVILLVFVIILPMFVTDISGQGSPWFCKYICPAGMLQGGLPLTILNEGLRSAIGFLYAWKFVILAVTVIISVVIYRPFCKYICPLGAVYGLFNKVSVFRLRCDKDKCINCGKCSKICKMNVDPSENPCSSECIRCGLCEKSCPTGAIECNWNLTDKMCKRKNVDDTENTVS